MNEKNQSEGFEKAYRLLKEAYGVDDLLKEFHALHNEMNTKDKKIKIQFFSNGRWINQQKGIKNIHRARAELMCIFNGTWITKEDQDLDDRAFDVACNAELGQVVVGATGIKWRIFN